jgi:MoxR-like ATPase
VNDRRIDSIDAVTAGLNAAGYVTDRPIATAIFLAHKLRKPILVEGPAGVGKTELAKAAARFLELPLVRLQCYDGLDEAKALYEWKYGKQLLYTQILRDRLGEELKDASTLGEAMARLHTVEDVFFAPEFLAARPLLRALQEPHGAVLLIDEIDKSDQEFEAFLLELLSDFQVTIPEIGTIGATVAPLVILTSNDTRDLGDALKRRCLHLHIGFPDREREERILDARVPGLDANLRAHLVAFVQRLRTLELRKSPSISETIDWAKTILLLHPGELDAIAARETLNVLLKYESDIEATARQIETLVRETARN